jgi:hypothetical protein
VVIFHRERLKWRAAVLFGALSAALIVAAPAVARAGFLDFLFGGSQERPPADINSYAEPPSPGMPMPSGRESLRPSGSTGHAVAFCVRLCDGQHFPLEHLSNATPVETCRAMCPASKTKVFYGSEIDHTAASDGAHYSDLDGAFVYRQHLVANCTCNGKDAFGLAPFDLSADPTLRPGDMISTKDGFKAYAGKHGQSDAFTPVDSATVAAELNSGFSRPRLARRAKEPDVAAEEPGVIVPRPGEAQATR